ncbi:hypothetical protein [Pseudomonas sp.]|uniref:hypothetical protein n=1 Tax=Pseudomonas sp. TaxID=306 RepID=UPI002585C1C0|nr:hypothetical protein [Pseudomonas sp.]
MATGKLGSADLAAATDTVLYTVTSGLTSSFSAVFVNRSTDNVKIRLSIGSAVPISKDYIVYDRIIPPGGEYERTGLVASSGEAVVVRGDKTGISVRAHGFEEASS